MGVSGGTPESKTGKKKYHVKPILLK